MSYNKLIIVGNGFDLAHGLKTSYQHFVDWYMCQTFESFCKTGEHSDAFVSINHLHTGTRTHFTQKPVGLFDVLSLLQINGWQKIDFKSPFFKILVDGIQSRGWVDIEKEYFKLLKNYFFNKYNAIGDPLPLVRKLNTEFDFLIDRLSNYLKRVNHEMATGDRLRSDLRAGNFGFVFQRPFEPQRDLKVLNFNYTDTLIKKRYVNAEDVIHIHGQVSDIKNNPIIFGYGDETDPIYQQIEDSDQNAYLEHIKSFGYFRTHNYQRLLSFVDSYEFKVTVLGHSCGLSDRVLLSTIFEHENCQEIEIFYHQKADGTNNFKEITQEISRHFKPAKKELFRRRVKGFIKENFIPQQD